MEARFSDGAIPARRLRDIVRARLCRRRSVRWTNGITHDRKDEAVENPIAHINGVGRVHRFAEPLPALNGADQFQLELHVLDDAFVCNVPTAAIAGDDDDVEMRFEKEKCVVIVGAEDFPNFPFRAVQELSRREDTVDVDGKNTRLPTFWDDSTGRFVHGRGRLVLRYVPPGNAKIHVPAFRGFLPRFRGVAGALQVRLHMNIHSGDLER